MHKVLMSGRAEQAPRMFEFKIGLWSDGVGLMARDSGAGDMVFSGAGIWPAIDKAKTIAAEIARRSIGPDSVASWTEVAG